MRKRDLVRWRCPDFGRKLQIPTTHPQHDDNVIAAFEEPVKKSIVEQAQRKEFEFDSQ